MDTSVSIFGIPLFAFGLLALWEVIWKGVGMWYAAKNGHKGWYVFILVLNTMGILPILYLYVFGGMKKK